MSKTELKGTVKLPQGQLADVVTGEFFQAKSRNHYEALDPKPFAPQVELNRPTIRQRIENLLNRDPGVLQRYLDERDDGSIEMEVPDDPEAPLTASEQNFVDIVAADLAERAPLPDEGLPRPDEPKSTPAATSAGVQGAEPPAPGPAPSGSGAPKAPSPSVPTR